MDEIEEKLYCKRNEKSPRGYSLASLRTRGKKVMGEYPFIFLAPLLLLFFIPLISSQEITLADVEISHSKELCLNEYEEIIIKPLDSNNSFTVVDNIDFIINNNISYTSNNTFIRGESYILPINISFIPKNTNTTNITILVEQRGKNINKTSALLLKECEDPLSIDINKLIEENFITLLISLVVIFMILIIIILLNHE